MKTETNPIELELLDQCIAQVLSGELSVEECLQKIPSFRSRIEPLLRAALYAHERAGLERPNEAYKKNAKIRILNQVAATLPKEAIKEKSRRKPVLRLAYGLLAVVLALGLSLPIVLNASASALPGDPLYGVKRRAEEVRLTLTLNPASDAKLLLQYSDERLAEAEAVLEHDRQADALRAIDDYQQTIDRLLELTDQEQATFGLDLIDKIEAGLIHHQEILELVLESAPPAAKSGIENALQNSSHGKEMLDQIKRGRGPENVPPGQQKKTEQPETEGQGAGGSGDKPDKGNKEEKTPGPPADHQD